MKRSEHSSERLYDSSGTDKSSQSFKLIARRQKEHAQKNNITIESNQTIEKIRNENKTKTQTLPFNNEPTNDYKSFTSTRCLGGALRNSTNSVHSTIESRKALWKLELEIESLKAIKKLLPDNNEELIKQINIKINLYTLKKESYYINNRNRKNIEKQKITNNTENVLSQANNSDKKNSAYVDNLVAFISFVNLKRLSFVFYSIILQELEMIRQNTENTQALNDLTNNDIYRSLAVALLASRALINIGLIIKKVSQGKDAKAKWDIFCNEFSKSGGFIINDLFWAAINGCANWRVFGMSAQLSSFIFIGASALDLVMFSVIFYVQKINYTKQREYLKGKLTGNDFNDEAGIIAAQIFWLDMEWKENQAKFWYNIIGAALLTTGFAASMIFTPAGVILACFIIATIATIIFQSSNAFGKYYAAKITAQEIKNNEEANKNTQVIKDAYAQQTSTANIKAKRNAFILSVAENTVFMPAFLIASISCPPAAFGVLALYIIFKAIQSDKFRTWVSSSANRMFKSSSKNKQLCPQELPSQRIGDEHDILNSSSTTASLVASKQ